MYNKKQIAEDLYDAGLTTTKVAAEMIVDAVFTNVMNAVAKSEKVSIAGFGIFTKRATKARTARNPKTGAPVKLKASAKVAFKSAQAFKDLVAK